MKLVLPTKMAAPTVNNYSMEPKTSEDLKPLCSKPKRGRPVLPPVPRHAVDDPSTLPDGVRERYEQRRATKRACQRRYAAALQEKRREAIAQGKPDEIPHVYAVWKEAGLRRYYEVVKPQLAAERAAHPELEAERKAIKAARRAEWNRESRELRAEWLKQHPELELPAPVRAKRGLGRPPLCVAGAST